MSYKSRTRPKNKTKKSVTQERHDDVDIRVEPNESKELKSGIELKVDDREGRQSDVDDEMLAAKTLSKTKRSTRTLIPSNTTNTTISNNTTTMIITTTTDDMSEDSGDDKNTTPDERWQFDSGADLVNADVDGVALSIAEHLGWEGLAVRLQGEDRDDEEDELDQALAQSRVTSMTTVRGMRFWLSAVKGISKSSSVSQILHAIEDIDTSAYASALIALGLQLGIDDPTWGKVFAYASVSRPGRSGEEQLTEIMDFLEVAEESSQEFLAELARRSVFGTGTEVRILASADDQDVSGGIFDAVKAHMQHLLGEMRQLMEEPLRVARTKPANLKEQRAMDRLAWVLCNLERSRECVAIATSKLQELHIFANVPDERMDVDLLNLAEISATDLPEAQQATREFYRRLVASGMGARGRINDQLLNKAERRLRKTITYLGELSAEWQELRVQGHTETYGRGRDAMVHAEAGAADIAYKQSKAIEKMPDLEFQAELLNQEGITRRIEDLEVMIGISKLCCFHCLLLIRAMSKVAGIEMAVSGSHFNTYNWPVAEVLSTPEVLAAFLGLDGASKSPYAEFLLEAMKTEEGRRAIIIGIKEAKKLGGGDTTTDYISSEDEASDALGLTLARDEGARQGAVRHTRAPRVKKQNDDETEFEMFTDEDDEVDDDGNVIEDKEKKRKRKTKARQSTVIKRRLPVVEVTESNKRRRTRSAGAAEEKRTLVPVRRTNDDNSDSEPGSGFGSDG